MKQSNLSEEWKHFLKDTEIHLTTVSNAAASVENKLKALKQNQQGEIVDSNAGIHELKGQLAGLYSVDLKRHNIVDLKRHNIERATALVHYRL